jgi:ribonucleoside-diphosphate reductase beta chain
MKDGRIFGGDVAAVNQLLPHRNKWAWDLFLKAQKNNWVPTEVSMAKDVEQWASPTALSGDERFLLRRCLGFFAGSESLVANNLLLGIFRVVSDPECRQYILRQAYEEALHNQTVVYVCDSLGLEVAEVYEAYQGVPSIKAKDDFLMGITSDLSAAEPWGNPADTDASGRAWVQERKRDALRNIIAYYVVCEGIFFYSGFAMLLNFGRQNKLPGLSEQVAYTLRDEVIHIEFGTNLVRAVVEQEGPEVWTDEFRAETVDHIRKAVELEIAYARDVLPRGVLGLSAGMFVEYVQYIANRRAEALSLPPLFPARRNPFPWMTEAIDIPKQKNFFETRVIDYQTGGALLEDW